MLDGKKFLMGLNLLKCTYLNWNFDINNSMMIKSWYIKFQNLDDETFKNLLEKYTSESIYPPNSPLDILKYIKSYDSPEQAWNKILNIINRSINNQMFMNIMAKEENFLYQFVIEWDIDKVGVDSFGNKCYGYEFGRLFKRKYKDYLDSINIKKINNNLLIENGV